MYVFSIKDPMHSQLNRVITMFVLSFFINFKISLETGWEVL